MILSLQKEFKRRMEEESLTRIMKCLSMLSEETIWYSPNSNVNSVANLVLHLCGNISQYISATLGKQPDLRNREEEFTAKSGYSIESLKHKISSVITEAVHVVDGLNEATLLDNHDVQCFSEQGISILIHVIEHTSYHTGQITQMTKWICNEDTQYYPNLNLNKTN